MGILSMNASVGALYEKKNKIEIATFNNLLTNELLNKLKHDRVY